MLEILKETQIKFFFELAVVLMRLFLIKGQLYLTDSNSENFNKFYAKQYFKAALDICEKYKLDKLKDNIEREQQKSYEDIKNLVNANHNLGRPDLAKLCIKYGYADSVKDAFDKYLIDAFNKTRHSSKGLPYQECIELILNSGGIPVLAHPKSLELSEKEFLILLKNMIKEGLQGIEVYHSSHSKSEMDYYLEIANKYNLLISGGTDYHGESVKPDVELGTGINNNILIKKLSILDKL